MKSCEKVPAEHLLAYHLNALSPLRKLQLTWHLKSCADCQAGLLTEQALDSRLRRGENLAHQILAPVPSRQLALRLGGAALAITALVAGAVFLHPGTPGGPQIAFADVEKALSDSRYITWTQTYSAIFPKSKKNLGAPPHYTSKNWVEVASLRMAVEENETGYRVLQDSTHFEAKNAQGHYTWMTKKDSRSALSIKQMVLSPMDPNYPDEIPSQLFQTNSTPWQKESVIYQGKPAVHFSRTSTSKLASGRYSLSMKEEIWVDPETRHLLRRESHTDHTGGFKTTHIAENFRYTNTVPADTFASIRPKPGEDYTFSDPSGPGRRRPLEDKQAEQEIRAQVRQIVSEINTGNGKQLAALGDAALYASDGPEVLNGKTRAQRAAYLKGYLKYAAQQRVLRNWKPDPLPARLTSVLTYWHRHEEGAAYPPTGPKEVSFTLPGTATLTSGKRTKVYSYFVFRLTSSGPRLTWFNPNNHK